MMKKKWNIILITVLLLLTSVFLSACKTNGETEGQNSTQDVVSDEPIENDTDYVEDDETTDEDSSEEILDGHEKETVIDDDIDEIPEEDSEY